MGSRRQFFVLSCALLVLVCVMGVVGHGGHHGHGPGVLENTVPKESLITVDDVHNCTSVKKLSTLKQELEESESPLMRQIFAWLFPFGPGVNALLGTFYISSIPNLILAFIPAEIGPDTLNTMTAFATGGLLSDVFLHLIPHAFMGEHQGTGVHMVMVEEKRNVIVGLGIFVGFAAFFFMEKTLRVLGGEEGAGHSHSHSHSQSNSHSHSPDNSLETSSKTTGVDSRGSITSQSEVRERKPAEKAAENDEQHHVHQTGPTGPSVLSAYLNLFGDFVHNITDGLAMAASFYASPMIGATTTLACFAHEIPHEIADYSILIRSGFTKKQAMRSQFITAIGAFVGTFIGIAVHNVAASDSDAPSLDLAAGIRQDAAGIFGTTAQLADLVIPFVAGGFLYIGAVAVLPTLLAESKSAKQAIREFAAMAIGVLCMFLVAWNE